MKKLLFIFVIISTITVSCSKEDDNNIWRRQDVKLVKKICIDGDPYILEYDDNGRITYYDDYRFVYNKNEMTIKLPYDYYNTNELYCKLNSDGYITEISNDIMREVHSYKNGALQSCIFHSDAYYEDGSNYYNESCDLFFTYNWQNGNISSIYYLDWPNSYFSYSQYKNTPINIDLFYLTDDYACEWGYVLGFLGFFGRQNKYLLNRYKDGDDELELRFEYEFNEDGTVSRCIVGAHGPNSISNPTVVELYY